MPHRNGPSFSFAAQDYQSPTKAAEDQAQGLIILEHGDTHLIIARPKEYLTIDESMRRYLPNLPTDITADIFTFQTKDHPICQDKWLTITEGAWSQVIPSVKVLRLVCRTDAASKVEPRRNARTIAPGPASEPPPKSLFGGY
ncbi:hypothetical protein FA15DRAFT_667882 [Coprinopsis marcescibilis]|nr:hypothetical protein FA15DRAFT_667882 [Coprinopsis marcescibilis]